MIWSPMPEGGEPQFLLIIILFRNSVNLDLIVLSFLQKRNFDHVFQRDNARCHVARVCQDLPCSSLVGIITAYVTN